MTRAHAQFGFALAASLALLPGPGSAATVFTAVLDSTVAASSSPATGLAHLVLDDSQTLITYEVTYSGLQGVEFAAHIHSGEVAGFGDIIHHLPLGTPKIGSWEPSPRRVAELLAGLGSVMIHTDLYPEGELGGWLEVDTTPQERTDWSAIKGLFD